MSLKSSIHNSLKWFGRRTGIDVVAGIRRVAEAIIVFLYRMTGTHLMRIALNQMGIHKGTAFDKSGEQFVIEKIIAPHLGATAAIIDVGANMGSYTMQLKRCFPKHRIISYEPAPASYAVLAQLDGVEAFQMACADVNEERQLYFEASNTASTHASFSAGEFITDEPTTSVKVQCVRLEDEFSRLDLPAVGFLKVDAEGHDFEVLKGLGEKLPSVQFIQFEFNEFHVFTRSFIRDFHGLLSPTHDLFRIDTNCLHDLRNYHPYQEIFRYQNLLAVKRELTPSVAHFIKPGA